MKPLSLFTAATVALCATGVAAQDSYATVFGGYSDLRDPTFSGVITPPGGQQSITSDFGSGFSFGIALGTEIASLSTPSIGVRGELELSYSDSNVDGLGFSGNGPDAENNVAGDITSTRLFANVLADVRTNGAFTPYFGAGIGVARTDLGLSYGAAPGAVNVDDSSTNFSAQLIAGTSYALRDGVSLFGDVRLIRDFDVTSDRTSPAGFTGVVSDDIDTTNVNFGVRFNF
ncbi:porin family protein [Sulfitobacter albidus]|uniref:Porin family protein n=1 Tax=Sulfitobacter albidus TaxID=2829501 RepID=A0A975JDZ3_9RHOB|nr:outer membrane beta-barrel protein [Sulfitobacter albidus]QUJ76496.1 porin family protein [Sulfitobacter albidus]